MPRVLLPLAVVAVAVAVLQRAHARGLVVQPGAAELVSVHVEELSGAALLAVAPLADVLVSVRVRQSTRACNHKQVKPVSQRKECSAHRWRSWPATGPRSARRSCTAGCRSPPSRRSVRAGQRQAAPRHTDKKGTHEELALVAVAVGVEEDALALHLSAHPVAVEHRPVAVVVGAAALHLAVHPLAVVALLHGGAVGAVGHGSATVLWRQEVSDKKNRSRRWHPHPLVVAPLPVVPVPVAVNSSSQQRASNINQGM